MKRDRPCFAVKYNILKETSRGLLLDENARMERGSDVVFFERMDGDVLFRGTGIVSQRNGLTVEFDTVRIFEAPNRRYLTALAGSLEKVYRFLDAERHFRPHVVKLSRRDFDTIESFKIDFPRTVYSYLFAALSPALQTQFADENPSGLVSGNVDDTESFDFLAPRIVKFVEERVGNVGILLRQTTQAYHGIESSPRVPFDSVTLTDGHGENPVRFGRDASQIVEELTKVGLLNAQDERSSLLMQASNFLRGD